MRGKPFFDTNIVAYAFRAEDEDPRCEVARILLATGGIISVQVLNELVAVLRRKLHFSGEQVEEAVGAVRTLCPTVVSLTAEVHEAALKIAARYGYQIFDSLIIAAAQDAKCKTLYSEDMHHGQVIESLTICNPFHQEPRIPASREVSQVI
jgi:predicted nucleic acid-binding protein